MDENKLLQEIKKDNEKTRRHFDVVAESLESKLILVAESVSGIQKQLINIRDMVAQNTEDIEIIKVDLQFIKHELKSKVDRDEFKVLEKRIMFLERKMSRA